jgi:hypothetical protein
MDQFHLMGDARHEGRMAFRKHGVSGETRHGYDRGSPLRAAFVTGFSEERHRAAERALVEAQAYHALTVREAPADRAWAERLAAERGIH